MKLERENVIVFAGDSTTNAGKSTATNGLGDGYVKMVNNALNAFCPQNLYTIVNAGVDGDQSSDLLSRWDSDVIAYHPTVIFCIYDPYCLRSFLSAADITLNTSL